MLRQEFVIAGYTPPSGSRKHLGALLLGLRRPDGRLAYAGKVGTGFTGATLADLMRRLEPLRQKVSSLVDPPRERGVQWVKPELVAEVAFAEWTRDGKVRHPSFQGLREDKAPAEVEREEATHDAARQTAPAPGRRGRVVVAGVPLTNPNRVFYPDCGLTKHELALYYERIGAWMVPYAWHRPLTMVRCPEGIAAACFYQKAAGKGVPDVVGRVDVGADDLYLMIEDVSSAVALVQMGVLELHVWGARAEALEKPDMLVFDLDPGPNVSWARMVATALTMRELFENFGLTAFLRATGGKGLHLVVPIEPVLGWGEVKDFTHAIAALFAASDPAHYTDKLWKNLREGKVLIDYLRNAREATAITTWSARRREGAPVAFPLHRDLVGLVEELEVNLLVLERRVELDGDLALVAGLDDTFPDGPRAHQRTIERTYCSAMNGPPVARAVLAMQ